MISGADNLFTSFDIPCSGDQQQGGGVLSNRKRTSPSAAIQRLEYNEVEKLRRQESPYRSKKDLQYELKHTKTVKRETFANAKELLSGVFSQVWDVLCEGSSPNLQTHVECWPLQRPPRRDAAVERNTGREILHWLPWSTLKPVAQQIPRYYDIRDSQQMVWVLSGNVLITFPSSSNVEPVTLAIIACRHTEHCDEEKGNLIYLGIKDKNLSLFCTEIYGKPTLQLKEINIMNLYWENTSQKPFLFFHSMEGCTSAFQSVSYPDWFIATSSVPGQPIFLTQERGLTHCTNFYLYPKN